MANILILGGGFGGLIVAERLAAALDLSHQITLVAPNRNFTFYPGLVHLAFGECQADDITFDLGEKLTALGVRFVQGEMTRMSRERKMVEVAGDDFRGEISYDYLVIALGRRLATENVPGFFEYAHHLLGTGAAARFGHAVQKFREGRIIVGQCPDARLPVPVCETAFALARKFESGVSDGTVRISVIFPESLETAFGGATIHKELEAAFQHHGVNVLYDVPITEISENEILSSQKHKIAYDLLMLVPPFRGNASLRDLAITDESDFIEVDDLMRVRNLDHAYAVGDIVAFPGPKLAHMAVRQAEVATANLLSEIVGERPEKTYYHEITTIIDSGDADSIYLKYGISDDSIHRLAQGSFWGFAKHAHDKYWQARHR